MVSRVCTSLNVPQFFRQARPLPRVSAFARVTLPKLLPLSLQNPAPIARLYFLSTFCVSNSAPSSTLIYLLEPVSSPVYANRENQSSELVCFGVLVDMFQVCSASWTERRGDPALCYEPDLEKRRKAMAEGLRSNQKRGLESARD